MDASLLMWLLGGFATLVLGLLSLIWGELRAMRMAVTALTVNSARHEVIISDLPCRRGQPCPPEFRSA